MLTYLSIIITSIFINNIILAQFLGICPFLGVSKEKSSALGMGMAVTFVITMATTVTWLIQTYILDPLQLAFLQTIVFILVIAFLVQLLEIVMKKTVPGLYESLGVFLPLITTNCAVLGVAILVIQKGYNLMESITYGVATSLGFTLALWIFAGIREQLDLTDTPRGMRGIPLALVCAGILAMAFMGFSGIKIG